MDADDYFYDKIKEAIDKKLNVVMIYVFNYNRVRVAMNDINRKFPNYKYKLINDTLLQIENTDFKFVSRQDKLKPIILGYRPNLTLHY